MRCLVQIDGVLLVDGHVADDAPGERYCQVYGLWIKQREMGDDSSPDNRNFAHRNSSWFIRGVAVAHFVPRKEKTVGMKATLRAVCDGLGAVSPFRQVRSLVVSMRDASALCLVSTCN